MAWNEAIIKRILTNPFYCLRSTSRGRSGKAEPPVSEEEFIQAGTRFIGEHGAEEYIRGLLQNLKDDPVGGNCCEDSVVGQGTGH